MSRPDQDHPTFVAEQVGCHGQGESRSICECFDVDLIATLATNEDDAEHQAFEAVAATG